MGVTDGSRVSLPVLGQMRWLTPVQAARIDPGPPKGPDHHVPAEGTAPCGPRAMCGWSHPGRRRVQACKSTWHLQAPQADARACRAARAGDRVAKGAHPLKAVSSEPARREGRGCPGNEPSEGDSRQEARPGGDREAGSSGPRGDQVSRRPDVGRVDGLKQCLLTGFCFREWLPLPFRRTCDVISEPEP